MAVRASAVVVLSQQKKEAETKQETEPKKSIFAHKPSPFLNDMLKDQNQQE